jgi:hypothetical protein
MQHESIFDILNEVNHIINPDTADFSLDPTPIRPEGVRIVKEIPVTESGLYLDGTFYNMFSSLTRNKRRIEEMGSVRPISSCFDNKLRATINNTAIEREEHLVPATKRLKTMHRATAIERKEHLFPATKGLKTMNRTTLPIPLHASSFSTIFDQQEGGMLREEQPLPKASKIPSLTSSSHRNSSTTLHDESAYQAELRFREYQSTRWSFRFEELTSFHKKHGHCQVGRKENALLSQWIKRQRYQYKLKQEARHSTMTGARIIALEGLGFSWDSHRSAWDDKFNELALFKAEHGHCSVRSTFPENPQLSIWVKGQRRQLKLFQSGKISAMDAERTAKLNALGFCWSLRSAK